MKNLINLLVFLSLLSNLSAQSIDPEDQKLIESFVYSNINLQIDDVDQGPLNKVFSGTFYKMNVGFIVNENAVSLQEVESCVNVNGSSVIMIETNNWNNDCPVLKSVVKKDFLLKDENTAELFEKALNVIYPVDEDHIQDVKHFQKGSKWIFTRRKFFDDYMGFIVTTEPDGSVTKVEYNKDSSVE